MPNSSPIDRSALRSMILSGAFVAVVGAVASAQSFYFSVSMNGSQEMPPTSSTATGSGCFVLDTAAHVLTYSITFSPLSSTELATDIHCCAGPGAEGPVIFRLLDGPAISGSVSTTPEQEASMLQNLAYVSVHSENFPGGEIRGQMTLTQTPAPVSFCFGDGSAAACPCGNNSSGAAHSGCLNSLGTGGSLRATGVSSISCDGLELSVGGLPSSTSGMLFQGSTALTGGSIVVFGDGLRCAGGTLHRIGAILTSGGTASYPANWQPKVARRGHVTTPGTRVYQGLYSDTASFCQPSGTNLTNSVQVTWVP